jgi:hypothetical protein
VQVKTTNYYYTLLKWSKSQNPGIIKCWWGFRVTGSLICHCWGCEMVQTLWKPVWQFLTKLNIFLPYDLATTLFGYISKLTSTRKPTHGCF